MRSSSLAYNNVWLMSSMDGMSFADGAAASSLNTYAPPVASSGQPRASARLAEQVETDDEALAGGRGKDLRAILVVRAELVVVTLGGGVVALGDAEKHRVLHELAREGQLLLRARGLLEHGRERGERRDGHLRRDSRGDDGRRRDGRSVRGRRFDRARRSDLGTARGFRAHAHPREIRGERARVGVGGDVP